MRRSCCHTTLVYSGQTGHVSSVYSTSRGSAWKHNTRAQSSFGRINPITEMEVPQERVEKIKGFVEDRRKAEKFYDEQRISSSDIQAYEKKLDDTLRELQNRVRIQEEDLRKVRGHYLSLIWQNCQHKNSSS